MRRAAAFYCADYPWETLLPAIAAHEARCAALPPPAPLQGQRHTTSWDAFYRTHEAKFFHPRSYLLACFPALVRLTASDAVLECGAGNGSNLAALLSFTPAAVLAGDASPAALAALASVPACQEAMAAARLRLFPWDVTASDAAGALAAAGAPAAPAPAAAALLLFTLSAIAPLQHAAAVRNLVASMAPGAVLCFRDYGIGDLAQLRAPDAAILSASTHRRPDGTLAHYFSREEVGRLLEEAGCAVLELGYHTVANTNRKTGQRLPRVFVHAMARKGGGLA